MQSRGSISRVDVAVINTHRMLLRARMHSMHSVATLPLSKHQPHHEVSVIFFVAYSNKNCVHMAAFDAMLAATTAIVVLNLPTFLPTFQPHPHRCVCRIHEQH